ncbi:MAG: response regulator [Rhodocyclaceae bacterium]|nr:response regulator [Rhodocyclaceae bacterium]
MTAGPDTAVLDRLLLEGSSEILLLIDGDSLAILAANAEARRHMGDGLIGQAIGEYECALADMFFWDEMRGHGDSVISAESALRCADGQVLDVAKTVRRVSTTPLIYSVCATPVASHNRIESELANMGSRLRATLEATADGILLVDQEGAIINMNQRFSAMWQLPESLLVNRDDAGIFRHLDAQRKGEAETAETDEAGVQVQYLNDGRVFECSVHSAHAGEEVIGCVYSYRDVTERYRTQRELISARDEAKRASAAKGEFLATMSHEIRTPMNGVLGIAELLAGTKLDDEQTDFVRVIRSSGETLLGIINDILDYSKIEAGKLSLEQTEFSLLPLLEEVTALFRFRLREGGPTFHCTADGAVPHVLRGDPVRLRQILFNLVGNAFKFTERGRIDVAVTRMQVPQVGAGETAMLRFSVRDTGIGLSPEQCGRLFRSFEQADNSVTRKYGGTGLGLAICKRLVELMGGEIGVRSVVGSGSEFWFTARFAIAATPTERVTDAPVVTQGSLLTPAIRILLVEDNPINRKVISGMLKKLGGAEPSLACDGQEGVDSALRESFDLILMDTQMPVMDGMEATHRLRAAGLRTPIIGVSAGALEEERAAAFAAGVDDYVLKPVNLASLSAALSRALSKDSRD